MWYSIELEPISEEKKSTNYELAQSQFLKAQKLFEEELNLYTESICQKNYIITIILQLK